MLEDIQRLARDGSGCAFETTLSGLGCAKMIRGWRTDGYSVKLVLLSLATQEDAIVRVDS